MLRNVNPVRVALNVTFAALTLLYFRPGPLLNNTVEIAGWPLFALWVVVVGPVLILAVFALNSYYQLRQDTATVKRSENDAV